MGFHYVRVKGKLASPQEAPICVYAPHSSFLDVLLASVLDEVPSGLSKAENFRNPFLGALFMASESIGVSRDSAKSRLQSVEEVKYRTVVTRGQWPHLGVCPEGTCTNRKALITFKAGAFIPGCPVQPILFKYPGTPDVYTWVNDGPSGFQLLMFIMCQLHHPAEVEFLPVWQPNNEEMENPKLFAENVQNSMAKALGIPTTGHSFEDVLLMKEGSNLGLPDDAAVVEFQKVSSKLGMNLDYMKARLGMFVAIDTNRDGLITLTDFARHYRLPISSALKQMFSALDPDNKGHVTFRQYLIGTACLANIGSSKTMAQDALTVILSFMG
ncbi:predicted protein [Nematostella vectensis]|uniref:Phospholipid/glycerol acyltransferase domain-containing protein n=1 Tax=Nematostella vectensis TaxID=45351 RepID=A7RMR0_NEMVE|nr:predicted protein [Nematostella vectensis]|eukprot:XP_001639452.1 predicted protein [Nematostella vectensis]